MRGDRHDSRRDVVGQLPAIYLDSTHPHAPRGLRRPVAGHSRPAPCCGTDITARHAVAGLAAGGVVAQVAAPLVFVAIVIRLVWIVVIVTVVGIAVAAVVGLGWTSRCIACHHRSEAFIMGIC
jgi:hypothetical protein